MNHYRHFFNHLSKYIYMIILVLSYISIPLISQAGVDQYMKNTVQKMSYPADNITPLSHDLFSREIFFNSKSSAQLDLEEVEVEALQAEPHIRVLLKDGIEKVSISGEMEITGLIVPVVANGEQTFISNELVGPITITPTKGFLCVDEQPYRGQIILKPGENGFMVINLVKLEEYLYSVLPSEIDPTWPQEVLKAQAIAARCYAITQSQNRKNQDFDLYDDVWSQVYSGVRKEHPDTTEAVKKTRGQVLIYGDEIVQAYFFASGGGKTANSEDVWQKRLPYLRSVHDFDQDSPHYKWDVSFTSEEIETYLKAEGIHVGKLLNLIPFEYDESDRVEKVKIIGYDKEEVMVGTRLRFLLGLKSTKFTIHCQNTELDSHLFDTFNNRNANKVNKLTDRVPFEIKFIGYGWGHGVGLSQWGGRALALTGADYVEILNHYYQGIKIVTLYN